MRNVQRFTGLFLSIFFILLLTGCFGPSIKGKWIIKRGGNKNLSSYNGVSFDSKGHYQWVYMMIYNSTDHPVKADFIDFPPGWTQHIMYKTDTGSYTIDGGQILKGNYPNKPNEIMKFKIQGNKLILIHSNGNDFTYERVVGNEFPWITKSAPQF